MRHYLAERDTACPRCGYNLRNLTGSRCPECGDELRLQIGLVEPKLAAYICLLVGCALGVGGAGLLSLIALLYAPRSWWTEEPAGMVLLVEFFACLAGTITTLLMRRSFRRRGPVAQWSWAVIAWAVMIGLSLAVVIFFED